MSRACYTYGTLYITHVSILSYNAPNHWSSAYSSRHSTAACVEYLEKLSLNSHFYVSRARSVVWQTTNLLSPVKSNTTHMSTPHVQYTTQVHVHIPTVTQVCHVWHVKWSSPVVTLSRYCCICWAVCSALSLTWTQTNHLFLSPSTMCQLSCCCWYHDRTSFTCFL